MNDNQETKSFINSFLQIGGVWINSKSGDKGCDPNRHRNCHFYPNEKQLNQVTCSLSGFHFLPNVTRLCAAQEIAIASPTKHNILCQGKPALEIISSHPDFAKKNKSKRQTLILSLKSFDNLTNRLVFALIFLTVISQSCSYQVGQKRYYVLIENRLLTLLTTIGIFGTYLPFGHHSGLS